MKINDTKLCRNATLILTAAYFVTFLIYYLPSFVFESEVLSYISSFLRKGLYLLIPTCAAFVAFIVSTANGVRWAVTRLIPMTLSRIIYLLPIFYLMLLSEGYDSIEGVTIGLAISIGEAAIAYGVTVLVFFLMRFIQGYKREGARESDLTSDDAFDLSNKTSLGAFIVSAVAFLYFFIAEIVDTVKYIVEYSGSYRTGEIVYIVTSFIFDIALLFVYYFAFIFIKRIILKRAEK